MKPGDEQWESSQSGDRTYVSPNNGDYVGEKKISPPPDSKIPFPFAAPKITEKRCRNTPVGRTPFAGACPGSCGAGFRPSGPRTPVGRVNWITERETNDNGNFFRRSSSGSDVDRRSPRVGAGADLPDRSGTRHRPLGCVRLFGPEPVVTRARAERRNRTSLAGSTYPPTASMTERRKKTPGGGGETYLRNRTVFRRICPDLGQRRDFPDAAPTTGIFNRITRVQGHKFSALTKRIHLIESYCSRRKVKALDVFLSVNSRSLHCQCP